MCLCRRGQFLSKARLQHSSSPFFSSAWGGWSNTYLGLQIVTFALIAAAFKQSNVGCSSSGGDKVISMFLSPSFSSEDPKKPATDAQGDQSLTCPHLILWKWMEADHVYTGLCVCCVYLCLHHTLHGTQYV